MLLEEVLTAWSLDWSALHQLQDFCRLTHPQQCLLVKSLLLSGLQKPLEPATGMLLLKPYCISCHHMHPASLSILFKALCTVDNQIAPMMAMQTRQSSKVQ